ncbi:MAG TPA: hemerythrin domain-containing protein [Casimicrobiaceae bacterium]|nr:hemerythrin domain-containing protein [Casimicrobiaceae bacterium]
MKQAIEVIRSEHRALAAVLLAQKAFVDGMADGKYDANYALLADMNQYLTEVPDKVHHPKEDLYLFPAIRKRSPELAAVIDELEAEHRRVDDEWRALSKALEAFKVAGMPGLPAYRAAVNHYFDFQWQHVSKEESKILPRAIDVLTPEDWSVIDAAFLANDNPWEGPAGKYRELFTRIVTLAPAPIGVGPVARKS